MTSDLIVDVSAKQISMAVLEDQKLVELQRERRDLAFAVGDIYLGKVKKVMPGLNAAFVDVGYKKDAFLHYLDLGPTFGSQQRLLDIVASGKPIPSATKIPISAELPKEGKIADYIKQGQLVLVQVVKEPISTKGPRLSAELSLAGRNMVLVPFSDKVSVSSKIQSIEERTRLKQLMLSIKPKNFSVIVRTSAEGKKASELDQELRRLVRRWEESIQKLPKIKAPRIVYEEASRALGLLRDTFNPSFQSIHVNDADFYEDIKEYVASIAPGREEIVQRYTGKLPIFDEKGVTKQIKSLFGRTVTYKKGAYLVIEQTEAMHVIDVNSGNRSRKSAEQEETAVDVNMSAAEELARQLRLRDLGGIIVVDFIDMHDPKNRELLYKHMVKLMEGDRARHNILPLSKFGLMQITRQRVRPAMQITTEETCPSCMGTGKMKSSVLLTDQIEEKLKELVQQQSVSYINVHVHPYVAAYLNKGLLFSIARQWKLKIAKGIRVTPNQSLAFLDYKFLDKEGNEIELLEEDN
ncbi:Rne/Rng family ribonuclease [Porphyromonas sp. COT-290 OH3588]|uniref:Rne/Rng family ribonuclease n=1 Tax=Porphyromonas sp. COT-290 OH3588 TaxID=1515617 RepID=UPI00052C45BD|nr:Rne/Rng family ribonuclease [Porphyromonas sp. COT-290 OH3588]KGN97648.1 ribonuclease G [Porphyromonas sp. COT-290 OH3588]